MQDANCSSKNDLFEFLALLVSLSIKSRTVKLKWVAFLKLHDLFENGFNFSNIFTLLKESI